MGFTVALHALVQGNPYDEVKKEVRGNHGQEVHLGWLIRVGMRHEALRSAERMEHEILGCLGPKLVTCYT